MFRRVRRQGNIDFHHSTSPVLHDDDATAKGKAFLPLSAKAAIITFTFLVVGVSGQYYSKSRKNTIIASPVQMVFRSNNVTDESHVLAATKNIREGTKTEGKRKQVVRVSKEDPDSISTRKEKDTTLEKAVTRSAHEDTRKASQNGHDVTNALLAEVDIDEKPDASEATHPVGDAHALSKAEDEALELDERDGSRYHLVFSTDCSAYQHWQSYVVFYSALKIRQPGHVTRIASGCKEKEEREVREWFDKHVASMSTRFHLHMTPHFSSVIKNEEKVGEYEFFNKPFGLRHWLENRQGFGESKDEIQKNHEDVIIILVDPDQILLRPITRDFSDDRETVVGRAHKRNRAYKVEHGRPFAQKYGIGTQWQEFNLTTIAGELSPARLVNEKDAAAFYPVGPPYLATSKDMYQIAVKWTEFVPKVHAEYPHLLAEMYAFSIAAAHLEMPFQLIYSLMVSNTEIGGEGWRLVDAIPPEKVCEYAAQPDHAKDAMPSVMHFCQRYTLGDKWFFGKRKVPTNILTCEHPLLEEPPPDVATKYDYKITPGGDNPEKEILKQKIVKREAFAICASTAMVNEAALFFKKHHCSPGNMERINMYGLFDKKGKRKK